MKKVGDDWLGAARPPAPSTALRERVLAAARATTVRESGIVDQIWESRRVRWSWALLVSALLLGHAAVSRGGGPELPVAPNARGSTPEQLSRPRVIDVMLDPTLARSLLGEAP